MISVVVPIFNEQENLPELRRRMTAALDSTGDPWELILVNDGSRDASPQMIRQYHAEDSRIKMIDFSRNFGHQPAVSAGIHFARGDCVILIDGDLQDPPEVIPEMIKKWKEGFQVVLGQRTARGDVSGARGLGFRLFYPIFRGISDLPTVPDAGIFGLMDRRVVTEFNKLPERNRFIPGLRSWLGFKQASVLYERMDRAAGKPKQTLRRLIKYAMDGMVSFSYKPLRVATYFGFFVSFIAFLLIPTYVVLALIYRGEIGRGFFTEILMILFLGGVQLISIGILGEYIGRIYEEIKQRPLYVVSDTLGLEPSKISPRDLMPERDPSSPVEVDEKIKLPKAWLVVLGLIGAGFLTHIILWICGMSGMLLWPFVWAVCVLLLVNDASDQNGVGIPPFQVYALFLGTLVGVSLFVFLVSKTINPWLLIALSVGCVVYLARDWKERKRKDREREARRAKGLCVHCASPVGDALDDVCEKCGTPVHAERLDLFRLGRAISMRRQFNSANARQVLTGTKLGRSQQHMQKLMNRSRNSSRKK